VFKHGQDLNSIAKVATMQVASEQVEQLASVHTVIMPSFDQDHVLLVTKTAIFTL
jgi:hypothetical protein